MEAKRKDDIELAIKKTTGPCLIFAGAGTGKTKTIVEKVKWIVENKIYSPERIVCITFSNDAANNLLKRIRKTISFDDKEILVKTFHSFSSLLLKEHGEKIKLNKNFQIMNPDEAKITLCSGLRIPPIYCHRYINSIGIAKDIGIKPEDIEAYINNSAENTEAEFLKDQLESLHLVLCLKKDKEQKKNFEIKEREIKKLFELRKFLNAWKAYERIKEKKNFMDYSDLNQKALELIKKFPRVSENYDYIIVDEFQDTNKIQLEILDALSGARNITVVGDMNQSIYEFRGAYKENISLFKKNFAIKKSDIFSIHSSYRCPEKILKVANSLIIKNYENPEDFFITRNARGVEGQEIEVYRLKNEKEEARKIVDIIIKELENKIPENEICVMCRTHNQTRIIKKFLEISGINYSSAESKSLLKTEEIKLTLNYLKILNSMKQNEKIGTRILWELFYNYGFDEKDMAKIGETIKKQDENSNAEILRNLKEVFIDLNNKKIAENIIEQVKHLAEEETNEALDAINKVYQIIRNLKIKEEREITINLNKFYELAENFSKRNDSELNSFLNYVNVMEILGISVEAPEREEKGVKVMTSHSTKGLEYDVVIITNLAEGRFPINNPQKSDLIPKELYPEIKSKVENLTKEESDMIIENSEKKSLLSEERRLCYVSFTRAKKKLILTYAEEYSGRKYRASRFLEEINFMENPEIKFEIDEEEKAESISQEKIRKAEKIGVNFKEYVFSPSSLLAFLECQKKFEYKYILNMPEKMGFSWDSIKFGAFMHLTLEKGVKNNLKSLKEFHDLAKNVHLKPEWENIDISEAMHLIKIFFERNKNKYKENSLTEKNLKMNFQGLNFVGKADRIDFTKEGIEIIDYKIGKTMISPRQRNVQLGYYALAAGKIGKVKKVTIDLLRHDTPIEFEIDEEGNAKEINSKKITFNLNKIKDEITEIAGSILKAMENGFIPCPTERNCEFCEEYIYKTNKALQPTQI
ncbi:ATP-dependent helicase [Candidatus Pacearchaeota archaeon]|nr:ATP-dependent helicase [Candidatus Pacearchaeota archaeon]